jgi:hypothetical protein
MEECERCEKCGKCEGCEGCEECEGRGMCRGCEGFEKCGRCRRCERCGRYELPQGLRNILTIKNALKAYAVENKKEISFGAELTAVVSQTLKTNDGDADTTLEILREQFGSGELNKRVNKLVIVYKQNKN